MALEDLHNPIIRGLLDDLNVPDGFQVTEHGVYALLQKKGSDEIVPVRLTNGPLGVTARARDHTGMRWAVRLEWFVPETGRQHLIVPEQVLHARPGDVEKELVKRGLGIGPRASVHLRSYLYEARIRKEVPVERITNHLGYATELDEARPAFVLPSEVISAPSTESDPQGRPAKIFFQPNNAVESLGGYRTKGSLEGWQQALAPWGEHPVIVFAVLLGFAGAFKHLLHEENHGFHLFGDTSTGKTTAAQAAASVMGCPLNPARSSQSDGLFQTWNATANAVEMLLAPHSGMTVVLDEVGANDGGINLYNAFSGLAKARMTEVGGLRNQSTWSVVVVSTGEHSVRKHVLATSPGLVTEGANLRMLDIPIRAMLEAAVEKGAEPLPPASEIGPRMAELQAALAENFGWALPAAIRSVYAQAEQLGQPIAVALRETMDAHFKEMTEEAEKLGYELTGAHLRGLKRLALVSAIGSAVADVVPFSEEQIFRAVDAACEAWLGDVEFSTTEDTVLESLRQYVTSHYHEAHVEQRRANPPEGGWPYFYYEQQQVIVFKKEQLQRACGGRSLRVITESLRRHALLKGEEAGHRDAKLQAFMFPVVAPGLTPEQARHVRAYHLHAAPLLSDVLRPAEQAASLLAGVHVDEHGEILPTQDDVTADPAGDHFWPPHAGEQVEEQHPDDWGDPPENLATAVMPKRKPKAEGGGEHCGPESVPPSAEADTEPASEVDANG